MSRGVRQQADLNSSSLGFAARLRSIGRATGGATIIEFALILPVLLAILSGIIQFGGLFFLQSSMSQVARETARALVIGEIQVAGAQTYADARLIDWGITYSVTATPPNPPTSNDYVVQITAPLAEASLVDLLGLFQTGTLEAQATMQQ